MIFEQWRRRPLCGGVRVFRFRVLCPLVLRGQHGHHLSISGGKRRRTKQRTTGTKDITPPPTENKNYRKNQGGSISLFRMFSPFGTPRRRLPPPNRVKGTPPLICQRAIPSRVHLAFLASPPTTDVLLSPRPSAIPFYDAVDDVGEKNRNEKRRKRKKRRLSYTIHI